MFSFKNAEKLSRFTELECEVWRTEDMGSEAYRELAKMLPSDWGYHIPESDRYSARRMLVHARKAAESYWT